MSVSHFYLCLDVTVKESKQTHCYIFTFIIINCWYTEVGTSLFLCEPLFTFVRDSILWGSPVFLYLPLVYNCEGHLYSFMNMWGAPVFLYEPLVCRCEVPLYSFTNLLITMWGISVFLYDSHIYRCEVPLYSFMNLLVTDVRYFYIPVRTSYLHMWGSCVFL